MSTYDAFNSIDIRTGTILAADQLSGARKPAYKLRIDFGPEIGVKQSSAQLTMLYNVEDLVGRQILGVVNFQPRRIAGFSSEVLVLGVPDYEGAVVLIQPERNVANGARML